MSAFGRIGKRSVASHFCRLLEQDSCSNGYKTGRKVGDGHLIAYGCEGVVRRLLYFSVAQPGEVLLDAFSVLEGFLEVFAVSGHLGPSIVGHIEILCAAVPFSGIEQGVFSRARMVIFRGDLLAGLERATEFDSLAMVLGPSAGGFHLDARRTNGTAVRAEGLVLFLMSGIEGDIRLGFHLFDDEGIEVSDIVGLIGDEDRPVPDAEPSLERFEQVKGRLGIGEIVGQGFLNQTNAFLGNEGMGSVAPKEDHVFLFAVDELAGVIAQGGLGVPCGFFRFVPRVAVWIFEVVLSGGGQNRLGVEDKFIE